MFEYSLNLSIWLYPIILCIVWVIIVWGFFKKKYINKLEGFMLRVHDAKLSSLVELDNLESAAKWAPTQAQADKIIIEIQKEFAYKETLIYTYDKLHKLIKGK